MGLLNMLTAPMDARSNDPIIGYDEAGNPLRRSTLGNTYITKPQADPDAARRREINRGLLAAAQAGEPFEPMMVGRGREAAMDSARGLVGGLLGGIVEGITAPGRAARGEPVTLGDVWSTALDYGVGGLGGSAPRGALRGGPSRTDDGIRAYHGSPHDFDRFSMDAIGTGEGAQAYGHGLYFAESEDVARSYRDTLSNRITVDGQTILDRNKFTGSPTGGLDDRIVAFGGDMEAVVGDIRSDLNELTVRAARRPSTSYDASIQELQGELTQAEDLLLRNAVKVENPGSMYEVRINANPDDFLDWDAPLSAQMDLLARSPDGLEMLRRRHDATADLISQVSGRTGVPAQSISFEDALAKKTGADFMDAYTRDLYGTGSNLPPQRLASEFLRSDGIPGIKYRDAGSRGLDGAEGTRNFVVFDENLIEIVRKYGIAGAAVMLGISTQEVEERLNGA